MSALTFRGVRYESSPISSDTGSPLKQLVYRSPAHGERLIRSAPTAALLRLESASVEDSGLVYRGVPVRVFSVKRLDGAPVRPGGIIRSRMTAELIGINPAQSSIDARTSAQSKGVVGSPATAELLGIDRGTKATCRVYRGVAY